MQVRQFAHFRWLDLSKPTAEELAQVAETYQINEGWILDCLNPENLPKVDIKGSDLFWTLRAFDRGSDKMDSSVQELTTKLIVFNREDLVITIHNQPHSVLENIKTEEFADYNSQEFIGDIFEYVIESFDVPLGQIEDKTEEIEERVYALAKSKILRDGYAVKKRANALKKVLKLTQDTCTKLTMYSEKHINFKLWPEFLEQKAALDRLFFYTEDVFENIQGLMNLHVALLSQKTNEGSFKANEVMRVLTVFSIFFLPLNFIAGLYGMNFKNIPELGWHYGYFITLSVMILLSVGIYLWVRRKGWIGKETSPKDLS
ncbi:MAG: CorA family divalent cation transporter [Bdellovibrionia bacterium]